MLKTWRKIFFALIAVGALGFLIGQNALLGLGVIGGLLLILLLLVNLEFGLILVILSLVLGQLVRVPLPGTEAHFLLNDIIIPVLILSWLLRKLVSRKLSIKKNPINLPLILFLMIAILSLIWGSRDLIFGEKVISALYLVRFIEYALLFYLVLDLAQSRQWVKKYIRFIFICAFALALLGFLQYIFFPDFGFMAARAGWDPHVKRLLSTWFDPNFVGGFFVFILSLALALLLFSGAPRAEPVAPSASAGGTRRSRGIHTFIHVLKSCWPSAKAGKNVLKRKLLFVLCAVLFAALVLTYSRSAFFSFLIVLFLLGVLKSKKLLVVGLIGLLILVLLSGRLQTRLAGATSLDVTARHRIHSWFNTLKIVQDHPLLGIGYNTFRYAQRQYGTIGYEVSHSDFGSDSSLLTILATTGIFGFLAYLWLLGAVLFLPWEAFRRGKEGLTQAFGLGLFCALVGIFFHAQFTNSLLYPYFMQIIWISLAFVAALRQLEN